MSEPSQNWEPAPRYQRDLEPGELEELNRLRAWKEQQEKDALATQQYQPHQAPYVPPQQHAAYPPPQYAAYPPQQHMGPIQQVTVNNTSRADCPHLLHLVLTLITCGAWLPIWIIHAIIVAARN